MLPMPTRALRRPLLAALAFALLLPVAAVGQPEPVAAAGCAEDDHPGGDWPALNRDVTNDRHQAAEDVIGPAEARGLSAAWATSLAAAGALGGPQSTPSVAAGCVLVGTSAGEVVALDADRGEPVWRFSFEDEVGGMAGQVMGVAYAEGRVHAVVDQPGNPVVVALDVADGSLIWQTDELWTDPSEGGTVYSSPVVFSLDPRADDPAPRPMVFVTNSLAIGPGTRVPYYLLDARTGEVLRRGYPIPEEDLDHGYGGGGIWSTAAVDVEDRLLYVGTSDPETYEKEHPHNAAILRIDVDPTSPTFGEVTGAQKGRFDGYVPGGDRHPLCPMLGDDTPLLAQESSPVCGQLDVGDFGASTNLFVDEEGHKIAAAMQKSGVFFAIDTRTMTLKWEAILSYPLLWGNAATAAVGDGRIHVPADPAVVFGLSSLGWIEWVAPTLVDAGRYSPVTLANGVVYSPSLSGSLQAWDAATGVPLLNRPAAADTGDVCVTLGGGVAVARNTVYLPCDIGGQGSWIVAYRP
jgi:polyvinyl alcohol dehydrogenase (cytochrome)